MFEVALKTATVIMSAANSRHPQISVGGALQVTPPGAEVEMHLLVQIGRKLKLEFALSRTFSIAHPGEDNKIDGLAEVSG